MESHISELQQFVRFDPDKKFLDNPKLVSKHMCQRPQNFN